MKFLHNVKAIFLGPPTGYKTGMIWNKDGQIEERRWPIWDTKLRSSEISNYEQPDVPLEKKS